MVWWDRSQTKDRVPSPLPRVFSVKDIYKEENI